MTRIGIAGDWHCDARSGIAMLKILNSHGITDVYHLGDFGVYSDRDGVKYLRAMDRQLKIYGMRIFVTEGNHEDYKLINSTPVSADGKKWLTERIALLPRGYRWEMDGHSFVSFGGAASINFTSLKENVSWWKEEIITAEDVLQLAGGGEADIMFAHEAPLGIETLEKLKRAHVDDWEPVELAYSYTSQKLMTRAVEAVRPRMFFHGHYHIGYEEEVLFVDQEGEGFGMAVYGMNMNRHTKNIGILDCKNLGFEWVY
jgi:hypothetical protein